MKRLYLTDGAKVFMWTEKHRLLLVASALTVTVADRITACLNACENFPTENLEGLETGGLHELLLAALECVEADEEARAESWPEEVAAGEMVLDLAESIRDALGIAQPEEFELCEQETLR